jgi:type IV secretion system protein VirB4
LDVCRTRFHVKVWNSSHFCSDLLLLVETKRLEAAFRLLDEGTRLYQILFKRNRPELAHAKCENPWFSQPSGSEQDSSKQSQTACTRSRSLGILMVDGHCARTGLLHALSQIPKDLRGSIRELHRLF